MIEIVKQEKREKYRVFHMLKANNTRILDERYCKNT